MQERAPRIVFRKNKSRLKELLQKDKYIAIQQKNLQQPAIKINKVEASMSPQIMNKIFRFSKSHVNNPRSGNQFQKPSINTVQFGIESTVHLSVKI